MGNFDGIHIGHQSVIAQAQAHGPLGIITFEPHPREYFAPSAPAFRLMNAETRANRLAKLGVQHLYELPFDATMASLTPDDFARQVLAEGLGVIDRAAIAAEVKELDQESRSALRKHGVRFGQFTVFQPALLKPAPTRLRLVLWSLWNGLQEFPESPPPGLVTIPNIVDVPKMHYTLAGYHPAGARAIRIDMLERLADILRQKDSKAGFDATPDMLSITGMTLEQFNALAEEHKKLAFTLLIAISRTLAIRLRHADTEIAMLHEY